MYMYVHIERLRYYTLGIGRATAIALSAAGWKLTIVARNAQKLEETKSLCSGSVRGDVCVVVGDVTLEQDVERLFDTTLEQHGAYIPCFFSSLFVVLIRMESWRMTDFSNNR